MQHPDMICCKILAFTRDLTSLSAPTDSSKTCIPIPSFYLTPSPCSYWLSDLFYTPQPNIPSSPPGPLPINHIKSSHLYARGLTINPFSPLKSYSHPHFFFHYCIHTHIEKLRGYYTSFSHTIIFSEILTLTPFFTLKKVRPLTHTLLIPFKSLPSASYILNSCHRATLFYHIICLLQIYEVCLKSNIIDVTIYLNSKQQGSWFPLESHLPRV